MYMPFYGRNVLFDLSYNYPCLFHSDFTPSLIMMHIEHGVMREFCWFLEG